MTVPRVFWKIALVFSVAVMVLNLYLASTSSSVWLTSISMIAMFGGIAQLAIVMLVDPVARRYGNQRLDRGATLVIGRSVGRTVAHSLMFLSFAGSGVIRIVGGEDVGGETWLFMTFFAALGVLCPVALHWRRAILTMSPSGLQFGPFEAGVIAWSDIRDAALSSFFLSQFVVLDLSDEDKYLERSERGRGLRKLNPRNRFSSRFVIPMSFLDVSPTWLLEAIRVRIEPRTTGISTASEKLHTPTGIPVA
jgi:hypothetical protein